jgi:hypothetical protein
MASLSGDDVQSSASSPSLARRPAESLFASGRAVEPDDDGVQQ